MRLTSERQTTVVGRVRVTVVGLVTYTKLFQATLDAAVSGLVAVAGLRRRRPRTGSGMRRVGTRRCGSVFESCALQQGC